MARPRVTDDDVIDWWEWLDAGVPVKEIAARAHRSLPTIYHHLGPNGLNVLAHREAEPAAVAAKAPGGARRKVTVEEAAAMVAMRDDGATFAKIAADMGRSIMTVHRTVNAAVEHQVTDRALTPGEERIMAAFARINDLAMRPQQLAGAGEGALSASFPAMRGRVFVAQSGRQRLQDRMRDSRVRDELASAGLIPATGPRRHGYFS